VTLGIGWTLLLAALAVSFAAQGRISRALGAVGASTSSDGELAAGAQGTLAATLIVCALAAIGIAVLVG
jgi:hypothetical protein